MCNIMRRKNEENNDIFSFIRWIELDWKERIFEKRKEELAIWMREWVINFVKTKFSWIVLNNEVLKTSFASSDYKYKERIWEKLPEK